MYTLLLFHEFFLFSLFLKFIYTLLLFLSLWDSNKIYPKKTNSQQCYKSIVDNHNFVQMLGYLCRLVIIVTRCILDEYKRCQWFFNIFLKNSKVRVLLNLREVVPTVTPKRLKIFEISTLHLESGMISSFNFEFPQILSYQ